MKIPGQSTPIDPSAQDQRSWLEASGWRLIGMISLVLCLAAGLRFVNLGQLSFWYDEVVTVRLARSGSPAELVNLLFKIDATRAPLHPLLLEAWIAIFGHSEFAARSLSAIFGVLTVLVIFDIGRKLFDNSAGLYAAWLAVFSPLLVFYSREARMYAWLVLLTCLAWRQLLALQDRSSAASWAVYIIISAALAYSHPLGLLMLGTLASAGWLWRHSLFGGTRGWLLVHLTIAALVVPWCRYYLDHAPEFLSGPLPFKFLLGTPIAFIGGNFFVLGLIVCVIVIGIRRWLTGSPQDPDTALKSHWQAFACLLLWLTVPPTALYIYSLSIQPIFGPARYSVYVAPAFFLLIGAALSRFRPWFRFPVAGALTIISVWSLLPTVYSPDLKADWRGFARYLDAIDPDPSGRRVGVVVRSPNPENNVEVETARYYLPPAVMTLPLDARTDRDPGLGEFSRLFLTNGTNTPGAQGMALPKQLGPFWFKRYVKYDGLTVYEGFR